MAVPRQGGNTSNHCDMQIFYLVMVFSSNPGKVSGRHAGILTSNAMNIFNIVDPCNSIISPVFFTSILPIMIGT